LRYCAASAACGSHKVRKQTLGKRVIRHALGMPLNPHDPVRVARPLDALDGSVRSLRRYAKVFARPVNGLVMAAVDLRFGPLI
jgi:hypothetical protein